VSDWTDGPYPPGRAALAALCLNEMGEEELAKIAAGAPVFKLLRDAGWRVGSDGKWRREA